MPKYQINSYKIFATFNHIWKLLFGNQNRTFYKHLMHLRYMLSNALFHFSSRKFSKNVLHIRDSFALQLIFQTFHLCIFWDFLKWDYLWSQKLKISFLTNRELSINIVHSCSKKVLKRYTICDISFSQKW